MRYKDDGGFHGKSSLIFPFICFIFDTFHYAYKQILILQLNNRNTHTHPKSLGSFALFFTHSILSHRFLGKLVFLQNMYKKSRIPGNIFSYLTFYLKG